MKKLLLLPAGMVLLCGLSFSQTHSPDFLDGTVVFKLKNVADATLFRTDGQENPNILSREEALSDYPAVAALVSGIAVTKLERPAFYVNKPGLRKIFRLRFSDFENIDLVIARLQKSGLVEYAEKSPIYKTDFIPNDTYYSGTDKWYHDLVSSHLAWDYSKGRAEVKIAIVDNAVFAGHLDLTTYKQWDVADGDGDAKPPVYYNSDGSWSHGTHTAGLATADINNSRGIASLGAGAELIAVKATPDNATSSSSIYYSFDGVLWACQNGAHVVSMSFGGPTFSQAYQDMINSFPDVVFFAAAGNDNSSTVQYPGAYANVICVGSVNGNDSRSSFSNYNSGTIWVDIASPGGYTNNGLLSTVYTSSGNGYARMGGTSMSTPFAAGLAGLMLSLHPGLTPAQIENCLKTTGKVINQNIGNRINAPAAMQCVQNMLNGDPVANFFGDRTEIFVGDSVNFTDNSVDGGNTITQWQWTFTGGTPGAFVGKTPPPVFYNTAGNYEVKLTVTNAQNSNTKSKLAYIKVTLEPFGQWIEQASGYATASRGIRNISVVNKDVVWACAYDGSGGAANNVQEYTRTSNGGTNWTAGTMNLGNAALGVAMIHAADANTAWVAAFPNAGGQTGGVWKTINGGTTWTRQASATYNNAASFTNVVHFWGADTGFCQGDPINSEFECYTTVNGGTTWTVVPAANLPNPLAGEFGYTSQIEVQGDNVWFTTNMGRIYRSTDRGKTFIAAYQSPIADFGGTASSGNISFRNVTEGILVNNNAAVWKTSDGGATWVQVTTTGTVYTSGLCWIEGTDIIFTTGSGGVSGAGSSFSLDAGVTWNKIDTEQHLDVEFIDTATGWSGGFNTNATTRGMWKWKNLQNPMVPDFTADNINVCVGATVNFTDQTTGTTPQTWSWTFAGGTPGTSSSQNPGVTYNTPGTYDVTLLVDDGSGGQATKNKVGYIIVSDVPAVPGAITGLADPCVGATETYFVSSATGVTYNWTLPGDWTGTSNTNSITVTVGSMSGTVSVTASNNCGTSTASTLPVAPTTVPAPTAGFTFSIIGDSAAFTGTSSNATSWYWDFGDGFSDNVENPGHRYTANGVYLVMLIATNKCGADTITDTVNITQVGIREITVNGMKVFPNPASSALHLVMENGKTYTGMLNVMDVTGRVLMTSHPEDAAVTVTLDISTLPQGMYFVTLQETGVVFRFIKE